MLDLSTIRPGHLGAQRLAPEPLDCGAAPRPGIWMTQRNSPEIGHASGADYESLMPPPSGAVPVLRPQLPTAERLLPYLRRIDESRVYSNWGPLVAEFERRLCDELQLPVGTVTSAGSGTSALTGAILGTAGRATDERPLALLPAFTFVATAVAVEQCGYRPYLADVDAGTWMLDPERLTGHPQLDRIGVVVPVAPFGRPVPQAGWRNFREQAQIPVVIDGAASFDRVAEAPGTHLGEIPVAVSFHATKFIGTGEGGCAISTDTALVERVAQALNFGFHGTRESRSASINGKMSEYHAAVGLAELDGAEIKAAALEAVVDQYRRGLAEERLSDRLVASPDIGASYVLFRCDDRREAERVQRHLTRSGIDHRLWYGRGLHRHGEYATLPRDPLANTERLAPCLVGVPLATDLDEETIARIVEALAEGATAPS
jgi:dTDP-4-amino-4,6-dideoxygalactose transaminase